jgi:hypothetical protein
VKTGVAPDSGIEREFVYQMSWFTIGRVGGFFAACAIGMTVIAATDDRGQVFYGVTLSAGEATLFNWALTVFCWGAVLLALRAAWRRFGQKPGRIAFTGSALIVLLPHWRRGAQRIAYDSIKASQVGFANWNVYLIIRHEGGVLRLNRAYFSSRAAFYEASALLAERLEVRLARGGRAPS